VTIKGNSAGVNRVSL